MQPEIVIKFLRSSVNTRNWFHMTELANDNISTVFSMATIITIGVENSSSTTEIFTKSTCNDINKFTNQP